MEGAPRPDVSLGKSRRLTATKDFAETYAQGRSLAGRYMVLWVRTGGGASLRLGVVASRVIGDAVRRNRAKRRLREAWRLNRHCWSAPVDVVLVARRSILGAAWEDVVAELVRLARKAGLDR